MFVALQKTVRETVGDDAGVNFVSALQANAKAISFLRDEVEKLDKKIADLEQCEIAETSNTASSPLLDTPDDWLTSGTEEIDAEARIEEARIKARQRFDDIERALLSEQVDPPWRDAVDAQVQDAFFNTAALDGAYLDAMDCRSQRCRLEVEFATDVNLEAAQASLAFALIDLAPRMAVEYEDVPGEPGRVRAIMYFARKGYLLLEN